MSKAILVIDAPKTCCDCPICASWNVFSSFDEYYCTVMKSEVQLDEKPDWCPLIEVDKVSISGDTKESYSPTEFLSIHRR